MSPAKEIQAAEVHTELTHRGWRYALLIPGVDKLSLVSYETEAEAVARAEALRTFLLERVTA